MSGLKKERYEMLIYILIEAIYGYHCIKSGKKFDRADATEEFLGINDTGLNYPTLKNITQGAAGRILDLIELEKDE